MSPVFGIVVGAPIAEAVGEDLVDAGARRPGRRREGCVVEHQGEAVVDDLVGGAAQAAIQCGGVIGVEIGIGAIGDDEAIPEVVRVRLVQGRLPVVAGLGFQAGLIAGDIRRGGRHWDDPLPAGVEIVQAQGDGGHIVMEGPEADQDRRPGGDCPTGGAIERIA